MLIHYKKKKSIPSSFGARDGERAGEVCVMDGEKGRGGEGMLRAI